MPETAYRLCRICNAPIMGRRSDAVYCTVDCQHHGERALRRKRRRESLRCNYCGRGLKAGHAGAKYCSALCRSRQRVKREGEITKRRNKDVMLRKHYGLCLAEYDALVETQGGVCAICGESCKSGRKLAVDHCHESGAVRGLLCSICNRGLGQFKDRPSLLRAAADYIERSH